MKTVEFRGKAYHAEFHEITATSCDYECDIGRQLTVEEICPIAGCLGPIIFRRSKDNDRVIDFFRKEESK